MVDRDTLLALLQAVKSGDVSAEQQLLLRLEPLICFGVQHALKARVDDARFQDAFQEGRLAAVRAMRGWDGNREAAFSVYLFQCIKNAIYHWKRHQPMIRIKEKGRKAGLLPPAILSFDAPFDIEYTRMWEAISDPVDFTEYVLDRIQLDTLLRSALSDRDCRVFYRTLDGYTAVEVGDEFGITKLQVRHICARVRKLVREDQEGGGS